MSSEIIRALLRLTCRRCACCRARTHFVARNVGQHGGRREIGHRNCGGRSPVEGVNTTPLDVEEPDVRQSCCVQWRNSSYGLRGVRVGEASNPGPPRFEGGVR